MDLYSQLVHMHSLLFMMLQIGYLRPNTVITAGLFPLFQIMEGNVRCRIIAVYWICRITIEIEDCLIE